jgi:general stress protein 26
MSSDEGGWRRSELGNDEEGWGWALGKLEGMNVIALATGGKEGPHVRPVTSVSHGGAHYVLTSTGDAKVHQLREDPRFECYVLLEEGKNTGYVRFRGTVGFVEDPTLRSAVGDTAGFVESYWAGPDDPDMTVLHLDITSAEVMKPGKKEWEMLSR